MRVCRGGRATAQVSSLQVKPQAPQSNMRRIVQLAVYLIVDDWYLFLRAAVVSCLATQQRGLHKRAAAGAVWLTCPNAFLCS